MNTNGASHQTEEDECVTSFGKVRASCLDRLGMKIDIGLHKLFTAYVHFLGNPH